jgi:hypothetical protein
MPELSLRAPQPAAHVKGERMDEETFEAMCARYEAEDQEEFAQFMAEPDSSDASQTD